MRKIAMIIAAAGLMFSGCRSHKETATAEDYAAETAAEWRDSTLRTGETAMLATELESLSFDSISVKVVTLTDTVTRTVEIKGWRPARVRVKKEEKEESSGEVNVSQLTAESRTSQTTAAQTTATRGNRPAYWWILLLMVPAAVFLLRRIKK